MRIRLLVASILLIPFISFSQTDFRKGFIITNDQDTLSGWLKYRENSRVYTVCNFKSAEDKSVVEYGPTQIRGYGFTEYKFFASISVKKKDGGTVMVFSEIIVKGLVSLYKFEKSFLVGKEDQAGLQELVNEFKEVYVGEKLIRKRTNQYISTLSVLLGDCKELWRDIQKTHLSERPLTRLIENYNKCKGSPSKYFKGKRPWISPRLGICGGINISQLNFSADNNITYNNVSNNIYSNVTLEQIKGAYEPSKTPTLGITLDLSFPRLSERFSFISGVSYLSSKYYNFTISNRGTLAEANNYVTIDLQQLKLPLGLRYTFSGRKIKPFINAGFSMSFPMHSGFSWTQEVKSYNTVNTYNYDNKLKMKRNQTGLWGGLGVQKSVTHKLTASLELRYELTNGIVSTVDYAGHDETSVTNFQFIFTLRAK